MPYAFCVLALLLCLASPARATLYEVGEGRTYTNIRDVPLNTLQAGDTVKVYYRATPYREKFLVAGTGTASSPITIQGVPDGSGNYPVISGANAVSNTSVKYWNEGRQIILIGQYDTTPVDHVIIDGFVLRGAHRNNGFYDDGGTWTNYESNAAGIRAEYADNVTIRNCDISNCENGVFNGVGPNAQSITVEQCSIYDNGAGSSSDYLVHNVYMGADSGGSTATVQYCYFGEMQNDGQQCKFRTQTTIFRYNWVEGGRNSQLDLVDAPSNTNPCNAYVYGNVIIKPASTNNGRMIHFGEDIGSGRTGTLYFFNNTCIVRNTSNTTRLFDISASGASVQADNNIFYLSTGTSAQAWSINNNLSGSNNWLSTAITDASGLSNSITGSDPGFSSVANEDFRLESDSPCVDVVSGYSPPSGHTLSSYYQPTADYAARTDAGDLDLGAVPLGASWDVIPALGGVGLALLALGLAAAGRARMRVEG